MSVEAINLAALGWNDRVIIVMRKRGLYGYELAGRARIRPGTLSRALRYGEPDLSPEQRARIARALRVPIADLFGEDVKA